MEDREKLIRKVAEIRSKADQCEEGPEREAFLRGAARIMRTNGITEDEVRRAVPDERSLGALEDLPTWDCVLVDACAKLHDCTTEQRVNHAYLLGPKGMLGEVVALWEDLRVEAKAVAARLYPTPIMAPEEWADRARNKRESYCFGFACAVMARVAKDRPEHAAAFRAMAEGARDGSHQPTDEELLDEFAAMDELAIGAGVASGSRVALVRRRRKIQGSRHDGVAQPR